MNILTSGGVREAFFSDNYYKLLWGKRVGFAKIALEAGVVSYVLLTVLFVLKNLYLHHIMHFMFCIFVPFYFSAGDTNIYDEL